MSAADDPGSAEGDAVNRAIETAGVLALGFLAGCTGRVTVGASHDAGSETASADAPGVDVPVEADGGHDGSADATVDAGADANADSEACVPHTCQQLGFDCGSVDDGCGHSIDCGTCTGCSICGSDKPHVCGPMPACVCVSCSSLGDNCGQAPNGCGGFLDCGTCTLPETCGGGGIPNQCGVPP